MKAKKVNHLHWLLMLFVVGACESSSSFYSHQHYHSTGSAAASKGKSVSEFRERAAQLRKARSSPNQTNNLTSPLNTSASSLHRVTFLPEDSFEPAKRQYGAVHHSKTYGSKHSGATAHSNNSNIKRDLSEPVGFLNAVVSDHATASTNQDADSVRYPPNKAYKSSGDQPQSFSRRQRDFSESPISNPSSSASEPNESMNDDHESESGSPFSSGGSSASGHSSHEDSPADSNDDFPSAPHHSSSNSNPENQNAKEEEPPASYDGFGPSSSADDEHSARGNALDDEDQSHHSHPPATSHPTMGSLGSRPPTLPYSTSPYMSSFGPPGPPSMSMYRNVYSGGPPLSFSGYRPPPALSSALTYPLISSATGSYKALSSESYPSGPLTATKYRGYGSTSSSPSFGSSSDDMSGSGSPMFSSPFSFDSFPSSSDTFGSTPTGYGFKSSYGLSNGDLMGLNNNNWYQLNQQYLPLMMKQAGYPMMAGGYGLQYQTTTQAPEQESTKEKDKESEGGKKKNRLRFNLNRLQAIRLNNLKLPSLFSWHKNSTSSTTQSSVN